MPQSKGAPTPLRVTIDCSSEERDSFSRSSGFRRRLSDPSRLDVSSFCSLIHNAIPTAVKDGRFVINDYDQTGFSSDIQVSNSVAPPAGFIPKLEFPRLKTTKLKVPKIKVPTLRAQDDYPAPRVGRPMSFSSLISSDETSAERMEIFKKGVQKMLRVVKVLGQIDQYLSERTRIIIDKLAKTFAD